jgi:hypothetical protein
MSTAKRDTTRAEGVYPRWDTYPQKSVLDRNILIVERVHGDCTVTEFSCTRNEAYKIRRFLEGWEQNERN